MWTLFSFFLRRMVSNAETGKTTRRRPLHTLGVSALEIAHRAYGKVPDYNGPLSSVIKALAILARLITPIVYLVQYQWLAGLAFTDDNILALENIVQKFLPPARYVFDKVDALVLFTETLPEKFDDAIKDFPAILYQVPLLNILVNMLTKWGTKGTRKKEILIDVNCKKYTNWPIWKTEDPSEFRRVRTCQDGSEMVGIRTEFGTKLPTYKEALEKGTAKKSQQNGTEEDDDLQRSNGERKGTAHEEPRENGWGIKAGN